MYRKIVPPMQGPNEREKEEQQAILFNYLYGRLAKTRMYRREGKKLAWWPDKKHCQVQKKLLQKDSKKPERKDKGNDECKKGCNPNSLWWKSPSVRLLRRVRDSILNYRSHKWRREQASYGSTRSQVSKWAEILFLAYKKRLPRGVSSFMYELQLCKTLGWSLPSSKIIFWKLRMDRKTYDLLTLES